MKITKSYENHVAVLMLGIAMCFAFFATGLTAAHAEEISDTETGVVKAEDDDQRAELLEQIETLRATIQSQREALKVQREENVEEIKAEFQENKVEYKSDLMTRRDELIASLADASPEEKREALMEFMTEVRAELEAKKSDVQENREVRQEKRKDRREAWQVSQEEFRSSLGELSPAERVAAILDRAQSLSDFLADRIDEDEDSLEVSDDEVSIIGEGGECDPITDVVGTDEVGECMDEDGNIFSLNSDKSSYDSKEYVTYTISVPEGVESVRYDSACGLKTFGVVIATSEDGEDRECSVFPNMIHTLEVPSSGIIKVKEKYEVLQSTSVLFSVTIAELGDNQTVDNTLSLNVTVE